MNRRRSPSRRWTYAAGWSTAATLLALTTACKEQGTKTAQERTAVEAVVAVNVATATRDDVPIRIHAIGWVEAYASVTIKPQIEGQITEIHFTDGQDVKARDLLYSIDPRPFVGALRLAQANLLRDKSLAQDAEREAARANELFDKNMAADRERDQTRANADAAGAQVQADEAAVESAKLRLEYCTIKSPIDGRVGARFVDRGNIVKANETALVTINQLNPIYVTFSLAERHLSAIKEQMKAGPLTVESRYADDETHPVLGNLSFVDHQVDTTTGMVRMKATFENADHQLWPGRFVNVALTTSTIRDAVIVPSQALQTGQQGQFLFVVRKDQTVDMRSVTTVSVAEDRTVITSGVEEGEVVVTDGQLRLAPGTRVEVKIEIKPESKAELKPKPTTASEDQS